MKKQSVEQDVYVLTLSSCPIMSKRDNAPVYKDSSDETCSNKFEVEELKFLQLAKLWPHPH